MAQKKWRGQTAVLEITGNNMPTEAVGVLDDPEVAAPEQDVQELRGAGSTKRQDTQKTSTSVTVSGEVASWDIEAWDRLIDYDDAQDQLDDTEDVAHFEVTTRVSSADGSEKEIVVNDAYIDGSVPVGGSREEWWSMSLELNGSDLTINNTDESSDS
jgi:hypothetical protein